MNAHARQIHARQIESLVAPGVAEALGVKGTAPRPVARPRGYEAAVARIMRELSVENQHRLWRAAEALADAEWAGIVVTGLVVCIPATSDKGEFR